MRFVASACARSSPSSPPTRKYCSFDSFASMSARTVGTDILHTLPRRWYGLGNRPFGCIGGYFQVTSQLAPALLFWTKSVRDRSLLDSFCSDRWRILVYGLFRLCLDRRGLTAVSRTGNTAPAVRALRRLGAHAVGACLRPRRCDLQLVLPGELAFQDILKRRRSSCVVRSTNYASQSRRRNTVPGGSARRLPSSVHSRRASTA